MKLNKTAVLRITEIIIFIAVIAVIITAFFSVMSSSAISGKDRLEESLRIAVLECYCSEGIYPPDVQYLEDHYGLQVDEEKYTVIYSIFSENVMPDIDILEKGK